jgi:hypothetical protein
MQGRQDLLADDVHGLGVGAGEERTGLDRYEPAVDRFDIGFIGNRIQAREWINGVEVALKFLQRVNDPGVNLYHAQPLKSKRLSFAALREVPPRPPPQWATNESRFDSNFLIRKEHPRQAALSVWQDLPEV